MDIITNIDFANYPVIENDPTPFVKSFYYFRTIYLPMVNSLDSEDIIAIITESLNIFFERFEKFISAAPKILNENSLKQYINFNAIGLRGI
jgi:hypothetical protein